ncbi:MAG TPA: NUDIX domain-containing protein [Patescibacteria group bacterium]|nr:NUDIX domain-containing protein [Patescibacteria group bacterium]
MTYLRTKNQVSSGGVAFKNEGNLLQVVLICVGEKQQRWQLPKGIIDKGETPEITAVREVREEAGINCELLELLEKVEYWYVASTTSGKLRYHKFVYFFLMRFKSGEVSQHDHEVHEARWFAIDEAIEKIAFKSERDVLKKAKNVIGNYS